MDECYAFCCVLPVRLPFFPCFPFLPCLSLFASPFPNCLSFSLDASPFPLLPYFSLFASLFLHAKPFPFCLTSPFCPTPSFLSRLCRFQLPESNPDPFSPAWCTSFINIPHLVHTLSSKAANLAVPGSSPCMLPFLVCILHQQSLQYLATPGGGVLATGLPRTLGNRPGGRGVGGHVCGRGHLC